MRVYIAGPMSNYPEHNYPAFRAAAKALREKGHTIVSPHETTPCVDHANPQPWIYYLRHDLLTLLECHAIAFLPGWETSRGAKLEHDVAVALEYTIYDVVDGDLRPR
jgi:hypothetical protein